MLSTTYTRHTHKFATKTAKLVCDGCRTETPERGILPQESDSAYIRMRLDSAGWTRRLDGVVLKDYCPTCSRVEN